MSEQTYAQAIEKIDTGEFTNVEKWNIHSKDYDKKAEVRQDLLTRFPDMAIEKSYNDGETPVAGYYGWVDMPEIGAVAFVPFDDRQERFFAW